MDNEKRKEIAKFYLGCAILSLHKFFSRLFSTCAVIGVSVGIIHGIYKLILNPVGFLWIVGLGLTVLFVAVWLDAVEWARRITGFGKLYSEDSDESEN